MSVSVCRHSTAVGFRDRAQEWLLRDEAEHNLLLGIIEQLLSGKHTYQDPIYLATIEDDTRVVGCAFRTPPFKLGLTRMPSAGIPALVEDVAGQYEELPAVLGPPDAARGFARAWAENHGLQVREGMRQRIYELDAVRASEQRSAGSMRAARAEEFALARRWAEAFEHDAAVPLGNLDGLVRQLIDDSDLYLWIDDEPRSMAAVMGTTPHGARIGMVYTPPETRRHGYASALVAELSRQQLADGKRFCFLYTDLSNPTTNTIYQRIGYQPVCDMLDVLFVPD